MNLTDSSLPVRCNTSGQPELIKPLAEVYALMAGRRGEDSADAACMLLLTRKRLAYSVGGRAVVFTID